MDRLKLIGALAFLAALYGYAIYGMARFLTTGQAYARHFGWTTFAEHPPSVAMSLTVDVVILVGGPLAAYLVWSGRRSAPRHDSDFDSGNPSRRSLPVSPATGCKRRPD